MICSGEAAGWRMKPVRVEQGLTGPFRGMKHFFPRLINWNNSRRNHPE
jgi:hypothetical protein